MRTKNFLAVAVCLVANVASAATISVKLQDLTGGTAAGVHTIGVYVKADQATAANGISGAQIDVIAQDTNSNYNGTTTFASTVGGNGYSTIKPTKIDATSVNIAPQDMPAPVTGLNNGNLDAVGLSFSTTPGNVDPTTFALGQTGGFELIARENWVISATTTIKAWVLGAQYFDSADSGQATDTFHDYDAAISIPFTTGFPEPGSVVLMGLGGLGLAAVARRRIRKA